MKIKESHEFHLSEESAAACSHVSEDLSDDLSFTYETEFGSVSQIPEFNLSSSDSSQEMQTSQEHTEELGLWILHTLA